MARERKNSVALNINSDEQVNKKLTEFCGSVGLTKTKTVEKALNKYIEEYYLLHPEESIELKQGENHGY